MIGEQHLIVVAPTPTTKPSLSAARSTTNYNDGTCEVVAVTDGESADELATPASRRRMAERRRAERAAALAALGADAIQITELHLPDRSVRAHAEALARTLSELFERRQRHFRNSLIAAPWRYEPHTDHTARRRRRDQSGDSRRLPLCRDPDLGLVPTLLATPTPTRPHLPSSDQRRRCNSDACRASLFHEPARAVAGRTRGPASVRFPRGIYRRQRGDPSMTLSPAYFDALYAASTDPWGLASRQYEARKYAITLATLPRPRYKRTFEPGCSIGTLTRMLATRADHVLATDASSAALAAARRSALPKNVRLEHASVPEQWPHGRFDLIVFSELGYYFDEADLESFVQRAVAALEPDGHLIAVHWRQPVPDYPGTAASVHSKLLSSTLVWLAHYHDEHFLLDLLGASPASALIPPDPEQSSGPH